MWKELSNETTNLEVEETAIWIWMKNGLRMDVMQAIFSTCYWFTTVAVVFSMT